MVFALLKHMDGVDYMFCHQVGTGKGFCLHNTLIVSLSRVLQMSLDTFERCTKLTILEQALNLHTFHNLWKWERIGSCVA